MKNTVLLLSGIVVSLLFLFTSSGVFELMYYDNEFSNEMYNEGLYSVSSVVTVLGAWGAAGLFYYVINSVRFSRWYHWLVMLCSVSILVAVINFMYISGVFSDLGYDFATSQLNFAFSNLIITAVLFTIASFSCRWWSSNCRHTPIPE